jgi:hypothetical protein
MLSISFFFFPSMGGCKVNNDKIPNLQRKLNMKKKTLERGKATEKAECAFGKRKLLYTLVHNHCLISTNL